MRKLFLITLSYPYDIGQEDTFLKNEVNYYKAIFSDTIILPSKTSNKKSSLDGSYFIDKKLSEFVLKEIKYPRLFLNSLKMPVLLFRELSNIPFKKIKPKAIKRTITDYLLVMAFYKFFNKYFCDNKTEILIYTYWFTPITTAATLYSRNKTNVKVITRAHGIDLFIERNNNFLPFRNETIKYLEKLILVSEYGKKYIQNNYPNTENKLLVSPIGTTDFNVKTNSSSSNNLSIVSCSTIDSNKRIDLIIQGISDFSIKNPQINITWNHFGDGPLLNEIVYLSQKILLNNVSFKIWGEVKNEEIINFYKTNPVDVFITTSASEGGRPISICEAMCCYIPILATNAGGISEIVTAKNGKLLEINCSCKEIYSSLYNFLPTCENINEMKLASREIWESNCNSNTLNLKFSKFLKTL